MNVEFDYLGHMHSHHTARESPYALEGLRCG
jgi:hypothetical protein